MRTILVALVLIILPAAVSAQHYAWYPSYYGGGYYRAPFYTGGLPYRGYNGYHMADRPTYRPSSYRYNWSWGGGNRGYLGGRGGGWGGEW